jgi:hypothetical protein
VTTCSKCGTSLNGEGPLCPRCVTALGGVQTSSPSSVKSDAARAERPDDATDLTNDDNAPTDLIEFKAPSGPIEDVWSQPIVEGGFVIGFGCSLLDYFHPPLSRDRYWESFHAAWLGSMADDLNRRLPPGLFAEEQVHAGAGDEIDVDALESQSRGGENGGGASPQTTTWQPPLPALTVPAVFADDFEVRVLDSRGGPTLIATIELVSPRNKDRSEARRAFATKCASYLHQGISLVLIDVVTERHANLHNEIVRLMEQADGALMTDEIDLYAVAYRPIRRDGREEIDLWPATLRVAEPLPTLPLALNAGLSLPLDLEATYTDARQRRRVG